MKKALVFYLFTFSMAFVQAQTIGLTCGINNHDWYFTGTQSNQISGQPVGDYLIFKPDVGGEFGITVKDKLSSRVSINGEFLYAQRNVTFGKGLTHKNQYLSVPIFLSYNVYQSFSFDLGLEYSRLYKSNIFLAKDYFDNLNFLNGIVGVRYEFLKNLNIHARYIPTFNRINEVTWTDSNGKETSKSNLRSRTFSLSVGYDF